MQNTDTFLGWFNVYNKEDGTDKEKYRTTTGIVLFHEIGGNMIYIRIVDCLRHCITIACGGLSLALFFIYLDNLLVSL